MKPRRRLRITPQEKKQMEQFITSIESQQPITEFDEETWTSLVDFVTVYSEKDIRVTFRDGTEV